MKRLLSILTIPFFVAACGGGGSGSTNVDASGFWSDPDADGQAGILITKSGELWGIALSSPSYTLLKGTASTSGSTFTASGTKYSGSSSAQVTATGQVVAKSTLKGSSTTAGVTTQFALVYDSDYEATPTTASIAGTYTGSSGESMVVAPNGTFTGATDGCIFYGTLIPAANENFFRLSVTYDQATCQTNVTANGIVVRSGGGAYLVGGAVAGSLGDAFVLTKQ